MTVGQVVVAALFVLVVVGAVLGVQAWLRNKNDQ